MDELIKWTLTEYGAIGVVTLASIFLIYKYLDQIVVKLKSVFWKEIIYNNKPSKIIRYKISYWTDFKIKNIYIPDAGRRAILVDLLTLKFNTIDEQFIKPILDLQLMVNDMPFSEITDVFLHTMSHTNEHFKQDAIELGIPDTVLTVFNELHRKTLEKFNMNCQMILESNGIYRENVDKIEAILSLTIVMLELTIVDVERTLFDMNGSLTGKAYKGVVCG